MYRIGYIDDQPGQFKIYAKKMQRCYPDMELVLLGNCKTMDQFLEKIYEEHVDVLLIDYKMAGTYGFNGTKLISYINDQVRDLECFILTAVDQDRIEDGLVARRNRFSKEYFDTEAGDPKRLEELKRFLATLRESADVFRKRREEKVGRYQRLLDKRRKDGLNAKEEEEYLALYKVLSSYGMVEKLPQSMLDSEFEKNLDELLKIGDAILKGQKKD